MSWAGWMRFWMPIWVTGFSNPSSSCPVHGRVHERALVEDDEPVAPDNRVREVLGSYRQMTESDALATDGDEV